MLDTLHSLCWQLLFVCSQFKSQNFVPTLKTRTSKMVNPDLLHGEMCHKQQFNDDDSLSLERCKLHTYHQDPGMCPLSSLPTRLYNGGTTTRSPPISKFSINLRAFLVGTSFCESTPFPSPLDYSRPPHCCVHSQKSTTPVLSQQKSRHDSSKNALSHA